MTSMHVSAAFTAGSCASQCTKIDSASGRWGRLRMLCTQGAVSPLLMLLMFEKKASDVSTSEGFSRTHHLRRMQVTHAAPVNNLSSYVAS